MIKNIIFDMGGVFIEFNPSHFLNCVCNNSLDKQILMDSIFARKQWSMLDEGLLDEQELYDVVTKKIPSHLYEIAHFLIFHWNEIAHKYTEVNEYAKSLKARGYRLYLLSNASKRVFEECWTRIKFNEFIDGQVISAIVKMTKPNKEIYKYLLNEYQLNPKECVFIDDSEINVEAAISCKIEGIVHDGDINTLKNSLETILTLK